MNIAWEKLVKNSDIRIRTPDKERALSLIESALITGRVTRRISLDEESSTLIFRELYESLRQIGEALWWIRGFEARTHDVCMSALQELNVQEKTKLQHVQRFKMIRNDANYRGVKVSKNDALELITFWDSCGKEMAKLVEEQIKSSS